MPNSYVIDIRHYLDDKGNVPALPVPAMVIAYFCGAVVAWVSGWPGPDGELTNVPCRRSRARKPCWGEVYARLAPDEQRDRPDGESHAELDAELGEVQERDEPYGAEQRSVGRFESHAAMVPLTRRSVTFAVGHRQGTATAVDARAPTCYRASNVSGGRPCERPR